MDSEITTVCKARLSIADLDRQYYQSHQLTLAQQSSETISKSMMRIVAYIYNANDHLKLRQQQWHQNQPELIQEDNDSGASEIKLWIDLGQPKFKRIKKACKLSKNVIIYTYNKHQSNDWWNKHKTKLHGFNNLSVYAIDAKDLDKLINKRMALDCTLEDGNLQIINGDHHLIIQPEKLM